MLKSPTQQSPQQHYHQQQHHQGSGQPLGSLGVFSEEHFDPPAFVRQALTNNNEEGIRAFHKTLMDSRDIAASDLQKNVHKNYTEFITISKEISKSEQEILVLRGCLSDVRASCESFFGDKNPAENFSNMNLDDEDYSEQQSPKFATAATTATAASA